MIERLFNWFGSRDLMTACNRAGNTSDYVVINRKLFPYVISKTGEVYTIHPDLITYKESLEQYDISDLREDDVVLDLGANIGAFSLMCAKKGCCQIFAVEPILYNTLVKNILLNNLSIEGYLDEGTVIPLKMALGDGRPIELLWDNKRHRVDTYTFKMFLILESKPTFLKCDVEGAEWYIHPNELKGFRRIEIELHINDPREWKEDFVALCKQWFDLTIKKSENTWWLSGRRNDVP